MFFECNLPTSVPKHITDPQFVASMKYTLQTVHRRMELLEKALILSGLSGEDFSAGIRLLFDTQNDRPKLDAMSPEAIASAAVLLAPAPGVVPRRVQWPNAIVLVDTAFVTRHEWETIRALGIGGSDAAIIDGVSPYRTSLELYHSKLGHRKKINKEDRKKEFIFSYGHAMEPLVIEEFCRRTGAQIIPETRMFARKDAPYITANIDAIVQLPNGDIYVFEAKTTTSFNKDAWWDGSVPRHYVPQCRQYPAVLNDPRVKGTYIGCIYGNTPDEYMCSFIPLNKDETDAQLKRETAFWKKHVMLHVPPALSGDPERDVETLRTYDIGYADKGQPPVLLNKDFLPDIRDWLKLNEECSKMQKELDALKIQRDACNVSLISALGQATHGTVLIDDRRYFDISYVPRSRTSTDTEQLRLAYPEAYDACVTVNPESCRVFSIKVKKQVNPKTK